MLVSCWPNQRWIKPAVLQSQDHTQEVDKSSNHSQYFPNRMAQKPNKIITKQRLTCWSKARSFLKVYTNKLTKISTHQPSGLEIKYPQDGDLFYGQQFWGPTKQSLNTDAIKVAGQLMADRVIMTILSAD